MLSFTDTISLNTVPDRAFRRARLRSKMD